MYEIFNIIKEEQKHRAGEIRRLKNRRKDFPWGEVPGLDKAVKEFRACHIAQCELRGRSREEIEQPLDSNLPDEGRIYYYKKYIKAAMEREKLRRDHEQLRRYYEQTVCSGQKGPE